MGLFRRVGEDDGIEDKTPGRTLGLGEK